MIKRVKPCLWVFFEKGNKIQGHTNVATPWGPLLHTSLPPTHPTTFEQFIFYQKFFNTALPDWYLVQPTTNWIELKHVKLLQIFPLALPLQHGATFWNLNYISECCVHICRLRMVQEFHDCINCLHQSPATPHQSYPNILRYITITIPHGNYASSRKEAAA